MVEYLNGRVGSMAEEWIQFLGKQQKLRKIVLINPMESMCNKLISVTDSQWQYEGIVNRFGVIHEATFTRSKNNGKNNG